MISRYEVEPANCPHCGQLQDQAMDPFEGGKPQDGDLSVCLDCRNISIHEGGKLRLPTDVELDKIAGSKKVARAFAVLAKFDEAKKNGELEGEGEMAFAGVLAHKIIKDIYNAIKKHEGINSGAAAMSILESIATGIFAMSVRPNGYNVVMKNFSETILDRLSNMPPELRDSLIEWQKG